MLPAVVAVTATADTCFFLTPRLGFGPKKPRTRGNLGKELAGQLTKNFDGAVKFSESLQATGRLSLCLGVSPTGVVHNLWQLESPASRVV